MLSCYNAAECYSYRCESEYNTLSTLQSSFIGGDLTKASGNQTSLLCTIEGHLWMRYSTLSIPKTVLIYKSWQPLKKDLLFKKSHKRAACGVRVDIWNGSGNLSSNPSKAVYISHSTNTLGKVHI